MRNRGTASLRKRVPDRRSAGGLEVSWQVTGIRKDEAAQARPLVVQQDKPASERGRYLHPGLYGESQDQAARRGERGRRCRRALRRID